MELKEIAEFQKKFDKEHFPEFWKQKDESHMIDLLMYMVVALTGEVGEFANVVKKISRDHRTLGTKPSKERLEKLKDELTDCFIYTLILSNLLEMDLEKEYFRKMNFNSKRFVKYKNAKK